MEQNALKGTVLFTLRCFANSVSSVIGLRGQDILRWWKNDKRQRPMDQ